MLTFHAPLKSEQTSKLTEELAGPLRVMQEAARRIAKIAIESKMTVVEGESAYSRMCAVWCFR